jgi:membrane-associated HD superfamily phosphohydrolase
LELTTWSILYGLSSFISGLIAVVCIIYLGPYWKNRSAGQLLLLMTAVAIWSVSYGMEFISPGFQLKLYWVKIEYLGALWIGPFLLTFILSLTNHL